MSKKSCFYQDSNLKFGFGAQPIKENEKNHT